MTAMMLRLALFLLAFGLATAAAAQSAPREPTGRWTVDFADAQCVASRAFGTEEEPLYLVLKAPPLGDVMQVSVIRKASWTNPDQVNANVVADQHPPVKTNMVRFGANDKKLRVYQMNMRSEDFARVRGAKILTVSSPGLDESFSLSQIEPLLKVMDQCVADLRKVWNVVDPAGEQSSLAKRAEGNASRYFSDEDYPDVALRNDQSGTLRFAVLVDENGAVADCTVIETSGVAVLDAQTCAMIRKRAKFEPAVGTDGKPAKDAAIQRITWRTAD